VLTVEKRMLNFEVAGPPLVGLVWRGVGTGKIRRITIPDGGKLAGSTKRWIKKKTEAAFGDNLVILALWHIWKKRKPGLDTLIFVF
jgi:hypothetical protein